MKKLLFIIFITLGLISSSYADITKGLVGKEDLRLYDGVSSTFTRKTSTGGTATYNKIDSLGAIDVLQVYGDGSTKSDIAIANAVAQIGSRPAIIFLSPGDWVISSGVTVTIPLNITLLIPHGTIIDGVAGGGTETLVINGGIIAGEGYQIFGINLTVSGNPLIDQLHAAWWGFDSSASAAVNAVALQAAIDFGTTNYPVKIVPGSYSYGTTLAIPTEGGQLIGSGVSNTNLTYTGSAEAIKAIAAGSEDSIHRIILKDFTLTGNANATYGIYMLPVTQHYSDGVIDGIRITGFSKTGAYALFMQETYNFKVTNFVFETNDGGLYCGIEVIGTEFSNFWIRDSVQKGVHVDGGTAFNVVFESGIIDAPNLALTNANYGIYHSGAHTIVNSVHFEDLYTPLRIASGELMCNNVWFAGGFTANPVADAGATVFLNNTRFNNQAYDFEASVSTSWTNTNKMSFISGTYAIGAGELVFVGLFGTIVNVTSATTESIFGWDTAGSLRMGDITLLFGDGNVTLANGVGVAVGGIVLEGPKFWTPHAGDSITLRPTGVVAATRSFREVSRYFQSVVNDKSGDFNVGIGDNGRTFTNTGASGTTTASLYNTTADHVGTEITFVREASQTFRIDPNGTEIIRGGGAGKYMSLDSDGANVTLRLVSPDVWEVISQFGTITYEA